MPLSHAQKVMLTDSYGIALCKAVDDQGREFFHYVMAEPKEIERLYRDYDKGDTIDFTSYGTILCSGWAEPTEEDQALVDAFANSSY